MATLLEALSNGTYDLQNKRDLSGDFSRKLIDYRNAVVSDFLKFNINLNKAIAKIAKQENLNDDQIQRIVEEVNNQVYLIKYDKTRGSNQREVEFDIASVEGVKKEIKGENNNEEKHEEQKDNEKDNEKHDVKLTKSAFEKERLDTIEKVASTTQTTSSELFTGLYSHKFGDLSSNMSLSRDEYALQKIAQLADSKEKELNKAMLDVTYKASELADVFIGLEKLNSDPGEVLSSLIKVADLNLNEVNIIKDSINNKISLEKTAGTLAPSFEVNFKNVLVDNTPKFSLGKYSLQKKASVNCDIPNMVLSSRTSVSSFDEILKIATDFKNCVKDVEDKNMEYLDIREKCASINIDSDIIEDSLYSPTIVNIDGLNDSIEKQAIESNIAQTTIQKLKDAINSKKNLVKEYVNKDEGLVGTLAGNKVRDAKQNLDQAVQSVDKLKNSPKKLLKQNKKINDRIDKTIKTRNNIINNLQDKKNRIEAENMSVLNKAKNQSKIRNLFDKDVRNVRKQIKDADNKIKSVENEIHNSTTLDELRQKAEKSKERLARFYEANGMDKLQDDVDKANEMYRKAVRKTNLTRAGAVGVAGVAGVAGVKSHKSAKKREAENQSLLAQQYNQNVPNFQVPLG